MGTPMLWDRERFLERADLQPADQQLTPLEGGGSQLERRVSPYDEGAPDLPSDDSPGTPGRPSGSCPAAGLPHGPAVAEVREGMGTSTRSRNLPGQGCRRHR